MVPCLYLHEANGFIPSRPQKPIPPSMYRHSSADTAFLTDTSIVTVHNASCTLVHKPVPSRRRFWRKSKPSFAEYHFKYKYNQVELPMTNDTTRTSNKTTAILLIHPIGVGIGRWFYNRLLQSLHEKQVQRRVVVLVPDLLACASASNPTQMLQDEGSTAIPRHQLAAAGVRKQLPLLHVSDWSHQMEQLMCDFETVQTNDHAVEWCIVSNGGCVPIALDMGERYSYAAHAFSGNLTNIVLSAPPRLEGLLRDSPLSETVQKSYRTLSGVVGNVFWWYALRRNGRFIQTFSENNLAANPDNLGNEWTPACVDTAKTYPNSRYSTFAFLAGALQQSCRPAFNAIKDNTSVRVDVILGGDKRKNPARR